MQRPEGDQLGLQRFSFLKDFRRVTKCSLQSTWFQRGFNVVSTRDLDVSDVTKLEVDDFMQSTSTFFGEERENTSWEDD